jgi:hypothetical protein
MAARRAHREGGEAAEYSNLSHLWGLSSEEAFQEVYGEQVAFVVTPQCATNGCNNGVDSDAWAWSRIGDLGEVWVNENAFASPGYTGFVVRQNTVHELGHGIDQLGGGIAGNNLATAWATNASLTRPNGGFAGPFLGWQQSSERTGSEVFADMFLGWTYGQWGSNNAGRAKAQYMEANMPGVIALAVSGN